MSERLPVASCETALPLILAALPNIFRGPLWRQTSGRRYRAKIDGAKVGVVIAARSWRYDNHSLWKKDYDHLLEYKSSGKIDFAFVVAARVSKENAHTYVSHRDANELHEDLKEVAPRVSEFGQFWLLRPDLTPLGFAASEDEDDF
jgi:hypothetical protein